MKNVKFIVIFVFVILSLVSFGYTHELFQASANFSLGFPQNEFKDNVNQIGFSGVGHFVYNFRNSPFSMGLSLGFFVMYIDLAARYLKGGRAEYLKKGSIHQENDQVLYDVYRSTTDLVTGYIGVSFSF